jgi:hypothetical protein
MPELPRMPISGLSLWKGDIESKKVISDLNLQVTKVNISLCFN